MPKEDGHLVIVHQYPTPKMHAFLNPNRKKAHETLPKITETKREKQNTQHTHTSNKRNLIPHNMRPCCIYKDQTQHLPLSHIKRRKKVTLRNILRQPKLQLCQNHKCVCHGSDYITLKPVLARQKKYSQKYLSNKMHLPTLKQFNYKQICDSESKHKVIRTEASINLSSPNIYLSQKFNLKQSSERKNLTAQNEYNTLDSSYIKHFDYTQKQNFQHIENKKHRRQQLQSTNQKQEDQQAIENDCYRTNNFQSKKSNQRSEQSSSMMKLDTNQLNTIFHSYKKQQSRTIQRQNKRLKMYSARSNGMFNVPQENQLEQYLLNYEPMNPQFDLKRLVKNDNFEVINSNDKVYFGQIQKDNKHGRGINISERDIYEGTYQNNAKVQGYEKNKDGIFIGKFQKGKRHGIGKFIWKNGQTFEGEWKSGKKDGFGIWKSPKGDYYEGQWKENRQNGKGFYYHRGASKYKGYFKDFLKHGQGQQEFCNGDKYVGDYQYGKPHGYGQYTWQNGDQYEGQFIQGSRQGKGQLRQSSGVEYQGQFKNDMKHGFGTEIFTSGQTFSGEFKQGKRLQGKLSTKEGSQIEVKLTH